MNDDTPTQRATRDDEPTIPGLASGQKVFGRYLLLAQVGRGGMGVVWRGRDETLDTEVALKFLPESVAHDPAAIHDLKRETRRSLQLTHPNVVRIFDFVQVESMAAISMEFIEGSTLTQLRLKRPGQVFGPGELRKWVQQLCEALAYAHTKAKVVHRDLKPANLMIDTHGDLKVTDFGIAATLTDSATRISKTVGTSGTPVYMSPQQMMGEKVSVADDIYSLGATLYELLTGKPPFYTGRIEMQVMQKPPPGIAERRKELGAIGESIPAEWEETILACLAKEPSARPKSAAEVAKRLGLPSGLQDAGGQSGQGIGQKTAAPSGWRHRIPGMGTLATLAAAVLAIIAAGYYLGVYAPEQARLAELKRQEVQARTAADAKERERQDNEARKLKADQERSAAEAARLAAARGGIIIRVEPPGADVTVGALDHGVSPLTIKDVKLAKYPVKVRKAGYEDWSGEVEVKENEFAELNATLVRSTGSLVINSEPDGVEVRIRGLGREGEGKTLKTPARLERLPTGQYELTYRQPGWAEKKVIAEVRRNATAQARTEFLVGASRTTPGKDWEKAASPEDLRAAAQAGNIAAMLQLGRRASVGMDGQNDDRAAVDWYRKAADLGDPAGMTGLGAACETGRGVAQDYAAALQWFRKAAALGYPAAMTSLGLVFEKGLGVTPNPATAVQWFRKAAELGHPHGMFNLGLAYAKGDGVAREPATAVQWLRKAARLGDKSAQEVLQNRKLNW